MLYLPTTFASTEAESGIGALGFSGEALLIQLITFVLVFVVLKKFAFGPILKVLNERRETIESGVSLGEKMRKDEAAMEAKVEKTLQEARLKADEIITGAQDAGRQAIREAEEKAKEKAAGILSEAESRIEQETARARKELEKELVSLISDATEAIIDEKVDATKDAALIERALKGRQVA